MNYTRADVKAVRDAIAAAVPDAHFAEGDFGFMLGVAHPTKPTAFTLFKTEYGGFDDDGNAVGPVVVTNYTRLADVPKIVELLRQ